MPDREYSSCQTLTGPSQGGAHTDFDAIGFTLTTTEGKAVSVYADRCGDAGGGGYSEAIVTDASGVCWLLGWLLGYYAGVPVASRLAFQSTY